VARYILARLVGLVAVLLALSIVVFGLMHAIPGGPFDMGESKAIPLPDAVRQEILKAYGLDKPLYVQYASYMWRALHFDFGVSFAGPETVAQLIGRTWKVSVQLGLMTFALSLAAGLSLGIWAALHQNSWVDYLTTLLAVSGAVFPNYVIGLGLLILLAVAFRWLPTGGWDNPRCYIMPVLAYAATPTAYIARYTRSAIVDALNQDYVRTARSKGLHERMIVLRHVLRNGLIPLLTILGPIIADLITGSLFIETIFRIPGLGRYFTTSILARDYPMIMGTTLLLAALMSVINLLTDILYVMVDPRVRLGRGAY